MPDILPRQLDSVWLHSLPPTDARARRARRELMIVNALMANVGIVVRELRAGLPARAVRLAELGAGDGRLALQVVRRLENPGGEIILLDRQAPAAGIGEDFAARQWKMQPVSADALDWLRSPATPRCDAIFTNLFLHTFAPEQLAELLRLIASKTSLFVACEPRRSHAALAGSRLLGLVGCNEITRHDAEAGVRAGFRGGELSSLWSADAGWFLEERPRGLFSHGFVAERA